MHMHSWPCVMAKCDKNKYDEVTFQLAAVDLFYYTYFPKLSSQTSNLKR